MSNVYDDDQKEKDEDVPEVGEDGAIIEAGDDDPDLTTFDDQDLL